MRKSPCGAFFLITVLTVAITTNAKALTREATAWQDPARMELVAQSSDDPGSLGTESASHLVIKAPEPGSMLLFGSGLVLLGIFLRRMLHANAKGK